MSTVERQTISIAELRERLGALTQAKLGIGVDEFLDRCRSHTLDMASPAVSRLAMLGRLLISAQTKH
jgi:hypothetical protein